MCSFNRNITVALHVQVLAVRKAQSKSAEHAKVQECKCAFNSLVPASFSRFSRCAVTAAVKVRRSRTKIAARHAMDRKPSKRGKYLKSTSTKVISC